MNQNYNIEDTAKLMTMASGNRNKKMVILAIVAIIAVAAVAVIGFKTVTDRKYDDQVALGDKALQEGNYEQAETAYLAAVKMNDRKPKARVGLAYVYALEGKTDQSVETYDKLYNDTGEKIYQNASDTVKNGGIPFDPEAMPAHGLWRKMGADRIPYENSLRAFLYCFNYDIWDDFDNEDPGENQILGAIMSGIGMYHVAIEDVGEDYYGNKPIGESIDGLDPQGWGEEGGYDLYGGYGKYDIEKVDWVAGNIFNLSEETIAAMQEKGASDKMFYQMDDSYICVDGWTNGTIDGYANEITEVMTDGEKFCIEYDHGTADYGDDYSEFVDDYMNAPLDRSEEYTTYYAVVEPKLIDGKHYWSIYYNKTSMPDYIEESFTAAQKDDPDGDGEEGESGGDEEGDSEGGGDYSVFEQLDGMEFWFSSGAGGWGTMLMIHPDGTFDGDYHDSDMGVTGDGYPNGTLYRCIFSGKFSEPEKVDEYTSRFTVESIDCDEEPGQEYIEDETMIIITEPYGISDGDTVELYLPGKSASELPEEFKNWMYGVAEESEYKNELKIYGLFNGEFGFAGRNE